MTALTNLRSLLSLDSGVPRCINFFQLIQQLPLSFCLSNPLHPRCSCHCFDLPAENRIADANAQRAVIAPFLCHMMTCTSAKKGEGRAAEWT